MTGFQFYDNVFRIRLYSPYAFNCIFLLNECLLYCHHHILSLSLSSLFSNKQIHLLRYFQNNPVAERPGTFAQIRLGGLAGAA